MVAVWVYLTRTGLGRRTQAVVQNRQLAATSGIDTGRVDMLTFFIGSGLAGVAGVALTLIGPVGAVLAAIGLGLLNSYAEFWSDASLAKVIVFAVIIAFLQIRPQGMFVLRSRVLT